MVAAKRFGWAVIATTSIIGAFGMAVYVRNPTTPLQPTRVKATIAGSSTYRAATNAEAVAVLDRFFDAMERDDIAAMRAAFPGITGRERRILRGIRRRMGEHADLVVTSARVRRATSEMIEMDFIVLAAHSDSDRRVRLPFTARTRIQNGEWKILDLR